MRVLFLDIDGVLNTHTSLSYLPINADRLRLLREIVRATNCIIVLSSSWRKLDETYSRARKKLMYKGMKIHSATTTDYFKERQIRGDEIQLWLDQHEGSVETYAILDDNSDMLESQMPYFVKTDGDTGLTKELVQKTINILLGEKS